MGSTTELKNSPRLDRPAFCFGGTDVMANADGIFLTIDIGEVGRMCNEAVFRCFTLGRLLNKEKLDRKSVV